MEKIRKIEARIKRKSLMLESLQRELEGLNAKAEKSRSDLERQGLQVIGTAVTALAAVEGNGAFIERIRAAVRDSRGAADAKEAALFLLKSGKPPYEH